MSKYIYKVCCRLHTQGGEHYVLRDNDHTKGGHAELEDKEYIIRKEVHNKKIKVDNETANEVLTRLIKEYGNCDKSEDDIYYGDVIICRNAVLNDKKYTFEGTLYEFMNKIQGDAGCKLLIDVKPQMTDKGFYQTGGCACDGERYDDGGEVYQIHHLRGYKYPKEPVACQVKKFDGGGQTEDEGLEQLKTQALLNARIYGIKEGAEKFAANIIKKTAIMDEGRKKTLQTRGEGFSYGVTEQKYYAGIDLTSQQELIDFYNKTVRGQNISGQSASGQNMSNNELQKYIDTITFDELYNGAVIPDEFYKSYRSFLDTGKSPYQTDVIQHFIKDFNLRASSEEDKSKIGTVVYWVSQEDKSKIGTIVYWVSQTTEKLNEFIQHPDLDAAIYIEKIDPKQDKIEYEHGWQYKAKISYPESLGEQGNYETGFVYKTYPSMEEQEKDIRDTLEENRKNIIEGGKRAWGLEEIYSGRDENILKAINKVLGRKNPKESPAHWLIKEKLNLFTDLLTQKDNIKEKAGVAIFYKDKILLTHPTGAGWHGTYSIPKGAMMQGETAIETAER